MKEKTRKLLLEAKQYCDDHDKSTEFAIQYLQDVAHVNHDTAVQFLIDQAEKQPSTLSVNSPQYDWSAFRPHSFKMMGNWVDNWFSNMRISPITVLGVEYKSVENYYQAQKTTDFNEMRRIAALTPSAAKREGKKLQLRPNWEAMKYEVMKTGLRAKFSQKEWKDILLATGHDTIIEWNNWNDTIWGVSIYTCIGHNLLGKALMEIRDELRNS